VSLVDFVTEVQASVDGVEIQNLDPPDSPYRVTSGLFNLALPAQNVLGLPVTKYNPSVSDGYWIMLAPLPSGKHTVHFYGKLVQDGPEPFTFILDITYNLTVVP